jgi:ParB family chromosome partitioning protein
MSKNDRKALGKGISSLLPSRTRPPEAPAIPAPVAAPPEPVEGQVTIVRIEDVHPNRDQPRRQFDPEALADLSRSIERDGVIQPILVRRDGATYQIIAGERRWRASKQAQLKEIPVIIRDAGDEKALEIALIENIQRENLNPIELAKAFYRMAEDLGLSHEEIGIRTGKDRATITNTIRLLNLCRDVQDYVEDGRISAGHARAMTKIPDEESQKRVANRCIAEGWSVRQIEDYTRVLSPTSVREKKKKADPKPLDPNVKAAVADMESSLGTRVRLTEKGKSGGVIEIEYYSSDDLDRIYSVIVGEPSGE